MAEMSEWRQVRLKIIQGADAGKEFLLHWTENAVYVPTELPFILHHRQETIVGRGYKADVRLSDATISKVHCVLRTLGAVLSLEDLNSGNGTFVNGERVHQRFIEGPATVQLGNTVIELTWETRPGKELEELERRKMELAKMSAPDAKSKAKEKRKKDEEGPRVTELPDEVIEMEEHVAPAPAAQAEAATPRVTELKEEIVPLEATPAPVGSSAPLAQTLILPHVKLERPAAPPAPEKESKPPSAEASPAPSPAPQVAEDKSAAPSEDAGAELETDPLLAEIDRDLAESRADTGVSKDGAPGGETAAASAQAPPAKAEAPPPVEPNTAADLALEFAGRQEAEVVAESKRETEEEEAPFVPERVTVKGPARKKKNRASSRRSAEEKSRTEEAPAGGEPAAPAKAGDRRGLELVIWIDQDGVAQIVSRKAYGEGLTFAPGERAE